MLCIEQWHNLFEQDNRVTINNFKLNKVDWLSLHVILSDEVPLILYY